MSKYGRREQVVGGGDSRALEPGALGLDAPVDQLLGGSSNRCGLNPQLIPWAIGEFFRVVLRHEWPILALAAKYCVNSWGLQQRGA